MSWRTFFPGMRTLKTGIAVTLCLLICQSQQIDLLFYAVIAAVISMDKNIWLSFHAGKSRMIGTFLGALLGGLFAFALPMNPWVCGTGIVLLIALLARLKLNAAIVIASIVFLAVTVGFGSDDPVYYSLMRLADTLLGIVVAWLVNILIFPYHNFPRIRICLSEIQTLLTSPVLFEPPVLEKRISILKSEIEIYQKQFSWRKKRLSTEEIEALLIQLNRLYCESVTLTELSTSHDPLYSAIVPAHQRRLDVYIAELKSTLSSLLS